MNASNMGSQRKTHSPTADIELQY